MMAFSLYHPRTWTRSLVLATRWSSEEDDECLTPLVWTVTRDPGRTTAGQNSTRSSWPSHDAQVMLVTCPDISMTSAASWLIKLKTFAHRQQVLSSRSCGLTIWRHIGHQHLTLQLISASASHYSCYASNDVELPTRHIRKDCNGSPSTPCQWVWGRV